MWHNETWKRNTCWQTNKSSPFSTTLRLAPWQSRKMKLRWKAFSLLSLLSITKKKMAWLAWKAQLFSMWQSQRTLASNTPRSKLPTENSNLSSPLKSNFNLPSQKNSSPSIAMKDKPTTTIADIIYEIILMSPIWGIGLVAGWHEISKFIETL